MPLLTNQAKNYVSIFIAPTVDLTTSLKGGEKGVGLSIGKFPYGNPNYAVILNSISQKPKTTLVNQGGSLDNENIYHYLDFFSGFAGKIVLGRVLGADSTTKVLAVKGLEVLDIDDTTSINIFTAPNISTWEDTPIVDFTEVVINACIATKHSISISNVNDYMTVIISDDLGNEIYSVSGGTSFTSVDDNGNPNYIGNKADSKILTIKVDTSHTDYNPTFEVSKTFDNGLVTEVGTPNYAKALNVISANAEKCDYAFTAGLRDATTIQAMRNITYTAKLPFFVDVYGNDVTEVIAYKTALNFNTEDVYCVWNRGKDSFSYGNQNIGLSGYVLGQSIARNFSRLVDDVEYRVSGIAGVDYPLPRIKANDLPLLSDDEKNLLDQNRINTIREINGVICIADVLSANPKEQATKLFNVAEGKLFIDRYIARIIAQKLFKNMGEAIAFTNEQCRLLFDKCNRNSYFEKVDVPYKYEVTKKNSDIIVVNYSYVAEGVARKGEVFGTITKEIKV